MKKHTLNAQKRDVVGRKVKKLRAQGLLPATVYGKKVKSVSLSVSADDFSKVFKEAGETGLVELTLEKETRPVLVHSIQKDPVTDSLLHVEFFQVDLKEKVRADVRLELIGEAPAVVQKQGVLLRVLDEIEVEALPTDLPEKIDVDVSGLGQVNQELKVSDLKVPQNVTVLSGANLTVAKIGSLVSKEAEAEEAAAAAAAAVTAEAQAAAAPAEGVPAEEGAAEQPQEEAKPKEEKKEEKT